MARPERTRARKAAQSTSTFLVMGEVSYSPEVIHGALSGISIIAGDHLGVFVLPLAPVGLGFAFKFSASNGAESAGEFDCEGDGIGIVWGARVMFAHLGFGFDADFSITNLPFASAELLDGFPGHGTEGVIDGELADGEAELGDDAVVFVGSWARVNGAYWAVRDFAGFLDTVDRTPFSAEDGQETATLAGGAECETVGRDVLFAAEIDALVEDLVMDLLVSADRDLEFDRGTKLNEPFTGAVLSWYLTEFEGKKTLRSPPS